MSNQATNTAAAAAPAKAKKPSIVDTFLKGCAKGFKVGIENITPAMILRLCDWCTSEGDQV